MWYDEDDPNMRPAIAVPSPQKVRGHGINGFICGGDPRYTGKRKTPVCDHIGHEKEHKDFSYLSEVN